MPVKEHGEPEAFKSPLNLLPINPVLSKIK